MARRKDVRRFRELVDCGMRRLDPVFGVQEQQWPALAALDQIDTRAFDGERVRCGVGPLQHFLSKPFLSMSFRSCSTTSKAFYHCKWFKPGDQEMRTGVPAHTAIPYAIMTASSSPATSMCRKPPKRRRLWSRFT